MNTMLSMLAVTAVLLQSAQPQAAPPAKPQTDIIYGRGPVDPSTDPIIIKDRAMPSKEMPVRPLIRKTVEVAGQTFLVTSMDRQFATISGGDNSAPRSDATLALRRTALHKATGCTLRSSNWIKQDVYGQLDCSTGAIP